MSDYKCGPSHGNYQHGGYSKAPARDFTVQTSLAKDLLDKILTTPCDGRGELPFTREEQQWALKVSREKPEWAKDILKGHGLWDNDTR